MDDDCDACFNGKHHRCVDGYPRRKKGADATCQCDHTLWDQRESEQRQEQSDYLQYG